MRTINGMKVAEFWALFDAMADWRDTMFRRHGFKYRASFPALSLRDYEECSR